MLDARLFLFMSALWDIRQLGNVDSHRPVALKVLELLLFDWRILICRWHDLKVHCSLLAS